MRLVSAIVRNYRVHRELAVEFDPQRTLIGGPNEAGKSTLVEAIHRTLFLKAKGNTEHHRAMRSRSGGHPEVELAFECGGVPYTIRKRFGPNGTVQLLQPFGDPLNGEAAEQKLAEILSVEPVAGRAVLSQWAHLWVWQGKACEDPSTHASSIKDDLLSRLQALGPAALLQSERDTRVAARIAALYEGMFTSSGKPKTGSELDAAERAASDGWLRRNAAASRMAALDSAVAALDAARAELPQIEASLRTLEKEQVAIEARFAQVSQLQRQHLEATHEAKDTATRHDSLKAANDRIVKLQAAIQRDEESLAPLRKELATLSETSAAFHRGALEFQKTYDATTDESRRARLQRDLAESQLRLFTLQKETQEWAEREQQVAALRKHLGELEQSRGRIPELDKATVRRLQKMEMECEKARHLVASVATGVELLSGDAPVSLGGELLSPGIRHIVTEEVEVATPDGLRLRITPGGGTTLTSARQELADQENALRASLAHYAIDSVGKGVESLAEREQLNGEIEKTKGLVETLGPEQIRERLGAAGAELTRIRSAIERIRQQLPNMPERLDESTARAAAMAAEIAAANAETVEASAKTVRDSAMQRAEEAGVALAEKQARFNRQNQSLEEKRAEARVLVQAHGEESCRHQAILAAEQALKMAQARVEAVQRSIEPLQPGMLEADRSRVRRSMDVARERKTMVSNAIAAAEVSLRSEGMEDPQATLAAAELQLRAAQSRLEEVKRHADAIALLHRCFQEEQRALSEQFTQPLSDKISAYLQCLFGPDVRAGVEIDDGGFGGLCIARGGSAERFGFNTLSGGTQEQTAAAVRLAMAEVLAADHHGCLPVVFDDAFVFSDPDRVQRLQRMLDHAAEAGLQVIVLTCVPGDYAVLGAHQIGLRPPVQTLPVPASANIQHASTPESVFVGRGCGGTIALVGSESGEAE
jgi:DNA repair exonuclease SbcCD ATPase subunit